MSLSSVSYAWITSFSDDTDGKKNATEIKLLVLHPQDHGGTVSYDNRYRTGRWFFHEIQKIMTVEFSANPSSSCHNRQKKHAFEQMTDKEGVVFKLLPHDHWIYTADQVWSYRAVPNTNDVVLMQRLASYEASVTASGAQLP